MTRIESIKTHLRNNKVTYISCGVTAVVVAGVTYYVTRNVGVSQKVLELVGDTAINNVPTINSSLNYKPTNIINNVIEFVERSTPSKQIGLLDNNGDLMAAWGSISSAATSTGLDRSLISRNVNNLIDNVKGKKFVLLDELVEAA